MDRVVEWAGVALTVVMLAAVWKIFTKAGQAGWNCLVPIYGAVVFLRIIGSTGWDRSRAWIWDFSSAHNTTARSGGL